MLKLHFLLKYDSKLEVLVKKSLALFNISSNFDTVNFFVTSCRIGFRMFVRGAVRIVILASVFGLCEPYSRKRVLGKNEVILSGFGAN